MLHKKVYSLSELRQILAEAKEKAGKEFDPVYGNTYSAKKETEEANKFYNGVKKQTKDFDGGLNEKEDKKGNNKDNYPNLNAEITDFINFAELDNRTKDRIESLAHGFASPEHEKNCKKEMGKSTFSGNAEFGKNPDIYAEFEKKAKVRMGNREEDTKAGLKARVEDPKKFDKSKNTAYKKVNENKKMKRLRFKNTTFLNESHMLSKIPDDYKVDGNTLIMCDSKGNEYLVECKKDSMCESYIHTNVLEHNCSNETICEALCKFNHLVGYNSSDYNVKADKGAEAEKYNQLLENTRKLSATNGKQLL